MLDNQNQANKTCFPRAEDLICQRDVNNWTSKSNDNLHVNFWCVWCKYLVDWGGNIMAHETD